MSTNYRQQVQGTDPNNIDADYVEEMLDSIESRVTDIHDELEKIEGLTEIDDIEKLAKGLRDDLY